MDWKPPDFFFFLFWARTISLVSGSTSEVHSEVGKVGRGLPGPSWREEQRGSTIRPLESGKGGCPGVSLLPIQADDTRVRSHDFSAPGFPSDWARTGQRGRELALPPDCPNSVTYQLGDLTQET